MEKGTLILKTEGGERKMSYSLLKGKYYLATKSSSNKANLVGESQAKYKEIKNIYLSAMPNFQKFLYRNLFGKKNDMFIILEQEN